MLITINKNFSNAAVTITADQNDYEMFDKDNVTVFIYGYPINFVTEKWLSSEDVYNYYSKNNMKFIHDIDGVYSIFILDKEKKQLEVITDRVGIYTMFFFQSNDSFIISDKIKEIKPHLPEVNINMESVIEFLNLGFKIGKKTLFENIWEFEPATRYNLTNELKLTQNRYWSAFDKKKEDQISKEDYKNLFNKNLQIATGLEEKIVTPISGGKDTRMLLSSILNRKEKMHCYTFGPKNHSDITESKKICNHFGIQHNIIEIDDDWAMKLDFSIVPKEMNINGIGPFFFNLHVRESMQREKDLASMAIQGELGNQLWRHHPYGYKVPETMDVKESASFMLKNITRVLFFKSDLTKYYKNLYKNKDISEIVGLILDNIEKDLKLLHSVNKPSDYSEFFIYRTLCYNLYSNILKYIGKHFKLFLPNLQKDLLEQLHLLSINQRVKGEYNDYIIASNNKYLSNLLYKNSGRVVKYIKMISNMITTKLFRFSMFNHPELHNYPKWIRKYHSKELLKTLSYDSMILAKYFNRNELEELINRFIKNKFSITNKKEIMLKYSNQHFVYNLFCLEQWLQSQE